MLEEFLYDCAVALQSTVIIVVAADDDIRDTKLYLLSCKLVRKKLIKIVLLQWLNDNNKHNYN